VVTGKELPHSSHAQYGRVKKISKKKAKPGDLVFFFRGGAHHVGIYIGKGRMIDARGYGEGVKVSPISGSWWGRSYTGMGRILPA
jgi:cell wall-associated NlpC family hydrolase